jgi:hypothetical protein
MNVREREKQIMEFSWGSIKKQREENYTQSQERNKKLSDTREEK